MHGFTRTDTSVLGRWWWTVDRWALLALMVLIAVGAILTMAASPPSALRLGLDPFHFVHNQFLYLAPAALIMVLVSLLTPLGIRRLATIGFAISFVLVGLTLLVGVETKGASRWLALGGFSIQPSELLKPCFAVVVAWMFAEHAEDRTFPGRWLAAGLLVLVGGLILLQPDFGMAVSLGLAWFVQLFLAGMPLAFIFVAASLAIGLMAAGYILLPHVTSRIDRFLDPTSGDTYQVDTSLRAFENGGLFGRGPGEGVVKSLLPDAHTDFIFAVAGEELGVLACLAIVGLFAFVVLRGFSRVAREANLFVMLAVAGLLTQFGLQAFINMGVTVRLLPAKGMTLPFVSYGGSSLLATAVAMGMMLALTRSRPGRRGLQA